MRAEEDSILVCETPIGLWDRLKPKMVNEIRSYSPDINRDVGCHSGIIKDSLGPPPMTQDGHFIHINYVSGDVIPGRYGRHLQ